MGFNGSGKTVMFKCICGFLPVTSGRIRVAGKTVGVEVDFPESIGVIIETPGFLTNLSGMRNLEVLAEEFSPRELPEGSFVFSGRLAAGNYRLKAVFAASEKYRLVEEYGLDCWTMLEDRRLLLERDFASYTNMRDWVLQFGDKAVVLEPEGLRAEILLQAENILRNYRET